MKVSEVMTRQVVTVAADAPISEAVQLMLDNRLSGLPVLDDRGTLVGILTEGDLLRRGETGTQRQRPRWLEILMGPGRIAGEYVKTHGRIVAEIMTRDVISLAEDAALGDVVQLMERHRIKRLPVLNGDRLVGLVSRADLLRALAQTLRDQPVAVLRDEEILERIHRELAKTAWVSRDGVTISVTDGIVDLNGVILEEKERDALKVVAENTPGVRAVEDHLVWIEPVSGVMVDPPPKRAPAG